MSMQLDIHGREDGDPPCGVCGVIASCSVCGDCPCRCGHLDTPLGEPPWVRPVTDVPTAAMSDYDPAPDRRIVGAAIVAAQDHDHANRPARWQWVPHDQVRRLLTRLGWTPPEGAS